jgi:hypothetical protein
MTTDRNRRIPFAPAVFALLAAALGCSSAGGNQGETDASLAPDADRPRADVDMARIDAGNAGADAGAGAGKAPVDAGEVAADAGGCPGGRARCGLSCVDRNVDDAHCGSCGHRCGPGTACFAGACAAPAPMPTPRARLAAIAGKDGRIYTLGGTVPSGAVEASTAVVEIYDPRSNSWSPGHAMARARDSFAAAAGPDGRIYVAGGEVLGGLTSWLGSVEIYDPEQDTWSDGPDLPGALEGPAAAFDAGGRLYVMGGDPSVSPPFNDTGTVRALAPGGATWTPVAAMAHARNDFPAVRASDGTIFVVGGSTLADNVGSITGSVEIYDPARDRWTSSIDLPGGAGYIAVSGQDGDLYVFLGTTSNYRYSLLGHAWSTVAGRTMPLNEAAGAPGPDGRIYIFGGDVVTDRDPSGAVLVYNPLSDRWVP